MGALSELEVDTGPRLTGEGKSLVRWWLHADQDDRDLFRSWVDAKTPQHVLADRLTRAGFPISRITVHKGLRLLKDLPSWES